MMSRELNILFNRHKYDWDKLNRTFEWIRSLKNCPQDPIFHAEGDVWTHTKMVMNELLSLDKFYLLSTQKQEVLFCATLMHDIGKSACTKEEDGRITSRGHSKLGAKMAREILTELGVDFYVREQICNLIRFHGLPIWFLDKENPLKEIVKASLLCDTELLRMLAYADAKGRICKDELPMADIISLFEDYCRENKCFGQKKDFDSNHSRFTYLSKEHSHIDYKAYDDTKFEVTIMSGLPGSGKDTWIAKNNKNDLPVISLDEIRNELGIKPDKNQGKVAQEAKERAKKLMRTHNDFIWNATNTSKLIRSKLISLFTSYGGKVKIVYIDSTPDKCKKQDVKRGHEVPGAIIEKLYKSLDIPDVTECHDVLYVY